MKEKHPRLWRFIRKINRGIALALAIMIVMTVWLSISEAKVKKDEGALMELTKSYIIDLIEVSSLMNSEKVGGAVSEATENAMKTALGEIVDKYYTDSKTAQNAYKGYEYRKNGTKLVDELSVWTEKSNAVHIQSVEIVEDSTEIGAGQYLYNYSFDPVLKAGKYLEVYFYFETQVVYDTIYPDSFNVYPFNPDIFYEGYTGKYDGEYGDVGGGYTPVVCRCNATLNISGRIVFVRDDGEWRIACTENMRAYMTSKSKYDVLKEGVK